MVSTAISVISFLKELHQFRMHTGKEVSQIVNVISQANASMGCAVDAMEITLEQIRQAINDERNNGEIFAETNDTVLENKIK